MAKQKVYTEDNAIIDAFKQYNKMIKSKKKGLATQIYNQCAEGGKKQKAKSKKGLKSLLTMEYQLEYLESTPSAKLPVPELDHSETVEAWKTGISDYKYDLANPKEKEKAL